MGIAGVGFGKKIILVLTREFFYIIFLLNRSVFLVKAVNGVFMSFYCILNILYFINIMKFEDLQ
jgi:hypothetical protein